MPYKIVKRGNKFAIVKKSTGETVGTSTSRAKAESSARARMGAEHGWKPTGKKRRGKK
jgi:hypothetical protein